MRAFELLSSIAVLQFLRTTQQVLLVCHTATLGADMRRVANQLPVGLEVRLKQLLEFTECSGQGAPRDRTIDYRNPVESGTSLKIRLASATSNRWRF